MTRRAPRPPVDGVPVHQRLYGGTATCRECGNEFRWDRVGPGRPPAICSDDCRKRRSNRYSTEYRQRVAPLEPGDPRHGTVAGYLTYSCDCDECRTFYTKYRKDMRDAKKAREAVDQAG